MTSYMVQTLPEAHIMKSYIRVLIFYQRRAKQIDLNNKYVINYKLETTHECVELNLSK